MYDLKERENNDIMPATSYEISANGKKILYQADGKWGIAEIDKIKEKRALTPGIYRLK
jgi:tricorn protease